jgi:hypothetical protein
MRSSLNYLILISLFVGAVVTPTFAFNEATSSENEVTDLVSARGKSPLQPSSELRKIAAQVRGWTGRAISVQSDTESTDTAFENKTSGESDDHVQESEITKLDQVFFTYVMSKYIKRVRLS